MTASVLARLEGLHGFVTEIQPSRCPCIDELGRKHPERCDPVECYRRVKVPWCRRLRERGLDELGVDLSQIETEWRRDEPPAATRASHGRSVRRWTPEEDARLMALKEQGLSNAAIGAQLGRTTHAIEQELTIIRRGRPIRRRFL